MIFCSFHQVTANAKRGGCWRLNGNERGVTVTDGETLPPPVAIVCAWRLACPPQPVLYAQFDGFIWPLHRFKPQITSLFE